MDAQLKEIIDLLYGGKRQAARQALMNYIQRRPKAADAWYLLSWAANTPEERRKAIYRALSLAPDEPRYQKRMAKLRSDAPVRRKPAAAAGKKSKVAGQAASAPAKSASTSSSRAVLFLLVLLLLVLFGSGALLLASGALNGQPVAALPTQAILPALMPDTPPPDLPTETLASTEIPPSPSAEPSATITIAVTATIAATGTLEPLPTQIETSTPEPDLVNESTPTAEALVLSVPTQIAASPAPLIIIATANSAQSSPQPQEMLATPTPEEIAAIASATATQDLRPSATPQPAGFVPPANTVRLNEAGQVLGGDLRVLEFTSPANSLLNDLGVSVPALPANRRWALLEVSLVCASGKDCLPQTAALTLVGASGARYTPDLTLPIDPLFGPDANMGGQVWGYLPYAVAANEPNLWLQVQSGSGVLTFALR